MGKLGNSDRSVKRPMTPLTRWHGSAARNLQSFALGPHFIDRLILIEKKQESEAVILEWLK